MRLSKASYARPTAMLATICALTLLTGCENNTNWDLEYTCSGQEQSLTSFEGKDNAVTRKTYASTVDFHLRAGQAMLKSSINPIHTQADGAIGFGMKTDALWTNGLFDTQSGLLTTIEGRDLQVAGRTQSIRTTGQYNCKARKSALMT